MSRPEDTQDQELRSVVRAEATEYLEWLFNGQPAPNADAADVLATSFARIALAAEQRGADRQREAAQYLVWSNEHMAWWRAQSRGYSRSILGAGLYTRAEALDIAATSRDGWKADRAPDEIAVSIDDIPPHIAAAIRNTKG